MYTGARVETILCLLGYITSLLPIHDVVVGDFVVVLKKATRCR